MKVGKSQSFLPLGEVSWPWRPGAHFARWRGTCPGTLLLGEAQCSGHHGRVGLLFNVKWDCLLIKGQCWPTGIGNTAPRQCCFQAVVPGPRLSHSPHPPVLQTGPALVLITPLLPQASAPGCPPRHPDSSANLNQKCLPTSPLLSPK